MFMSDVFLKRFFTHTLGQGLSMNMEFINSAQLAEQRTSGFWQSLPASAKTPAAITQAFDLDLNAELHSYTTANLLT